MIEIQLSIEIIFQQEELIKRSKEVIEEVKGDLGQKLGEATILIRILKLKTKEEIEKFEIVDKTETILEVTRVHKKEPVASPRK